MSSPAPTEIAVQACARCNQLRQRQAITIALLFTGYAAYYFCRSDLSVAMPLLIEKLHRYGMSTVDKITLIAVLTSLSGFRAAL
jgi:OPA family glycerol-3-phosphate transporter-like MFS transporter